MEENTLLNEAGELISRHVVVVQFTMLDLDFIP
jgi:hypothetical protein